MNNNLIENDIFIYFETLKSKLEIKLKNLALVFASKKKENNNLYFRYYKMIIYELISFDKFIELIKDDIIIIDICDRVSRNGNDAGRQRNKNLVFKISKDNLDKLFIVKYEYNNDLSNNFQIFN